MVWLSVMTPQKAARAKKAGVLMASGALMPPWAGAAASASFSPEGVSASLAP